MKTLKLITRYLIAFAAGVLVGFGVKPTTKIVDDAWISFPRYNFKVDWYDSSPVMTQVGDLQPPSRHYRRYYLRCGDCLVCHKKMPHCKATTLAAEGPALSGAPEKERFV